MPIQQVWIIWVRINRYILPRTSKHVQKYTSSKSLTFCYSASCESGLKSTFSRENSHFHICTSYYHVNLSYEIYSRAITSGSETAFLQATSWMFGERKLSGIRDFCEILLLYVRMILLKYSCKEINGRFCKTRPRTFD